MANSLRKCKHCAEYKPAIESIKTPAGSFCCMAHAIEFARSKSQRLAARKAATQHRERKMEVKPLSYWMKRAQSAVNKYIRLRDASLPCISCGRHPEWKGQWHASHFRSVGSSSSLRFNTKNIHKACSICNTHLSGNIMNYRPALIAKIGYNAVEMLESSNGVVRYSVEYLKRIEDIFSRRSKRILRRRAADYD